METFTFKFNVNLVKENSTITVTSTINRKEKIHFHLPTSDDFKRFTEFLNVRNYRYRPFCPPRRAHLVIIKNIPETVEMDEVVYCVVKPGMIFLSSKL
ncbi:hypothetical protein GWI33_022643 [Rhynchophorus ferrugineus]|uniref:Uncharacterized protein n=1 Tax=Rhynchophorus ferrugineus TaxID=354439 RepID=A0A834MHQ0_RHYFE|nr:hypothetical protein GWI33_022643 [Rhynchophorus ferrugineus]